ncbi:hypothetical protein SK128_003038 [Halocaridina rubra]|uniref:Sorting nexin/Vps5-like C-terminal domain-containing protein n=1 Tax=Halocaridina rubra TaxID=373956 RepID=A0AAN8XIP1_HALRR
MAALRRSTPRFCSRKQILHFRGSIKNPSGMFEAEKAKKEAETAFEECSDVARNEIKRFQRERSQEFQRCIDQYVEFQITSARATLKSLTQTLTQIKAVSL